MGEVCAQITAAKQESTRTAEENNRIIGDL
jgi:hypothetical protein